MENDILDTLEDLGYEGPMLEDSIFNAAVDEGARSKEYTELVAWATKELCGFFSIEESVNPVEDPDDCDTFLMELSGFLREYGCPYQSLVEGPMGQRLDTKDNKIVLLDYLLSELQASRMISIHKPNMVKQIAQPEAAAESEPAKDLKRICVALGFPRPPDGITPFQLFSKVETKLKEILKTLPSSAVSKPLLKARLSAKQWETVEFINKALKQEYEVRREMLLKRLDVTIQSFMWSDKAKKNENDITNKYQPIRRALLAKPNVGIAQMLASREDLTRIQKTSSGSARERTRCAINRVKIGNVPDRGGRAFEMEPPPPEMPSFQKRSNDPQGQRGHSGSWSGKRRHQNQSQQWWRGKKHKKY